MAFDGGNNTTMKITKLNYESLPRHILSQEHPMISKSCVKGLLNYFSKIYEFYNGTPLSFNVKSVSSFNENDARLVSSGIVKFLGINEYFNNKQSEHLESMKQAFNLIGGGKSKAEVAKWVLKFKFPTQDDTLLILMKNVIQNIHFYHSFPMLVKLFILESLQNEIQSTD
jgi:hypothetical protein